MAADPALIYEEIERQLVEADAELCNRDLRYFTKKAWHQVEPKELQWAWHLDAICDHLTWVTLGDIRNLMINIPPRMPVSVGARVASERGLVPLGEIVAGDRVLTHRGRYRDVLEVHEQGELDCLEISTDCGRRLTLQHEHPVFTARGWVEAQHLVLGDLTGCPLDAGLVSRPRRFGDDEAEAFLAGYFVGDGSTTNNAAQVTCADPLQIEHMRQCASRLGFASTVAEYRTPRVNFRGGIRPWLRERGLAERTSHTKIVPEFVLRHRSLWAPFLGAYMACDATFSARSGRSRSDINFAITTVSEALADQVLMMLGFFGIKARKRSRVTGESSYKPDQPFWVVQVSSQDDLIRLRERIYIPGVKGRKLAEAHLTRQRFDPDMLADHFGGRQEVGKRECRCLTVAEDESFVADGIAVHNTKSLLASVIWPVWDWLIDPSRQFLCASYAGELAIRDAVKSRRLIESAWFTERFNDIFYLDPNDNRKHRYLNNQGGHRISTSVGGKTTGEGGDVLLIDDPHNMKDVYSDTIRHGALNWWDNSMRSRLNDPKTGQKVLIGQRSHDMDLFGHILASEEDRWTVLMLPHEFDPARKCITYANPRGRKPDNERKLFEDPRKKRGQLLNPKRLGKEEIDAERNVMSPRDFSAQMNQDPTSGGGLILKKKWWQQWCYPPDHKDAGKVMPYPEFFEIVSVYDTAYEEKEEADFSARTTWGLFEYSESGKPGDENIHALLLERMNERMEFPELKQAALEHQHDKRFAPDVTLIEKKASGTSLKQELAKLGLEGLWAVEPGTNDKVFRAHMVSPIMRAGRLWYVPRNWAYDVINQCAKFPASEHDDLVDTVVMLMAYIRRMGMVLPEDEPDDGDTLKLFSRKFYG